ncbi:MAG: hypothetical protein ACYC6A_09410 [Armatimonadota bacterium]
MNSDEVIVLNDRRELFVDQHLIDRLEGTHLRLHEPVSGGVALRVDRPWEGAFNFGMSVIRHGNRYHLYYRGWSDFNGDPNGVGCVALSEDGVTWTKPALNLFVHPGWENNNIIVSDAGLAELSFPCAPWVDTRPGVPEDERIKAITCEPVSGEQHTAKRDPGGAKRMVLWMSADGFRFRRDDARSQMVTALDNAFDGGNTLFWSDVEQQYVLYYRICDTVDGVRRRTMARATSRDLVEWSDSVPMDYGDTPREQFYVNNTQPYVRAPHIYLAPAARFMESRRALTEEQAAGVASEYARGFEDCSDAVLLTSRAGSTRYDRTFMESFVHPGPGAEKWVTRTNYPLTGIHPCGPDRVMFFICRHYVQRTWHIERLLLRTDGFASVAAPWAGGEMITRPLTFSGQELEVNYRTGAPGFVRVEIQAADGMPLPGFTLDDCPEIIGDEIRRVVAWRQGTDVSRLAGQPVRLRFVMKDADLFSFKFGSN